MNDHIRAETEKHFGPAQMGRGWKIVERDERVLAQFAFEYAGCMAALLWTEALQVRSRMTTWRANVSVPYAAGPVLTTYGRAPEVTRWLQAKQRVLQAPLQAAECKTYETARECFTAVSGYDLCLLAAVFGQDADDTSRTKLVQRILRVCAPKLTPGSKHG